MRNSKLNITLLCILTLCCGSIDLNLFNSICKSTYIAVYMSILFSTWFRVLTLMSLYARLMARAGVVSTDDYEEFLIFVEANHLKVGH